MLSPVPSSNNVHIVIVKRVNETNGALCCCSLGNDRALSARSHCNFGALFALYSATAANVVEQQLGVDVWTAWMITVLWWLLLLSACSLRPRSSLQGRAVGHAHHYLRPYCVYNSRDTYIHQTLIKSVGKSKEWLITTLEILPYLLAVVLAIPVPIHQKTDNTLLPILSSSIPVTTLL